MDAFICDPGAARVVLFHGEDESLARDRAKRLAFAVAGSLDDPFSVVDLDRSLIDLLTAELSSIPMPGGRRVVRLRNGGDYAVDPIRRALATASTGVLIVEAGLLLPRSKLRTFVEEIDVGVAIACYSPDLRDYAMRFRHTMDVAGITVEDDAVSWVAARTVDHATAAREADKLVTFAGPAGHLTLEDVSTCIGDVGTVSLDDAMFAATGGMIAVSDHALSAAISDGIAPVQVIRAGLEHCSRLTELRLAVNKGAGLRDAAKSAKLSVTARRLAHIEASHRLWNIDGLGFVAGELQSVERACKQTGAAAETLARHCIMCIAQAAAYRAASGASLRGQSTKDREVHFNSNATKPSS